MRWGVVLKDPNRKHVAKEDTYHATRDDCVAICDSGIKIGFVVFDDEMNTEVWGNSTADMMCSKCKNMVRRLIKTRITEKRHY